MLRRWWSTVRVERNIRVAISRLVAPSATSCAIRSCCPGEQPGGRQLRCADRLAGRPQLGGGLLGPDGQPEQAEGFPGGVQVLPGVPGTAATAQFPAEKQLGAGPFERHRIRRVQPQRGAEAAFGVGAAARGQQRVAARGERPPGRAGGAAGPLVEDGERGGGGRSPARAGGGLDQVRGGHHLDQHLPSADAGAGQRGQCRAAGRLVPPVDQVEHRERPLGERARAAVRGGRLADLADPAQAGFPVGPDRRQHRQHAQVYPRRS